MTTLGADETSSRLHDLLESTERSFSCELKSLMAPSISLSRRPDQYTFGVKFYRGVAATEEELECRIQNDLEKCDSVSVYVHYPLCTYLCKFCHYDVTLNPKFVQNFSERLNSELSNWYCELSSISPIRASSIYFGGGTPSLMEPEQIEQVLEVLSKYFGIDYETEVTLESIPNSITYNKAESWIKAGINRVSIGVETLEDDLLRELNRKHSAADAITACKIASDVFKKVNADLIYALPYEANLSTLSQASLLVSTGIQQLTAYRLRLGRHDERNAQLLQLFQERPHLFPTQYDSLIQCISIRKYFQSIGWNEKPLGWYSHTKSPQCYEDRWETKRPLIGIGPSAYSYGTNWQTVNPRTRVWVRAAGANMHQLRSAWQYDEQQVALRKCFLDLRTEGVLKPESIRIHPGLRQFILDYSLGAETSAGISLSDIGLAFVDEIIDSLIQRDAQ